jgi:hypothetical protein
VVVMTGDKVIMAMMMRADYFTFFGCQLRRFPSSTGKQQMIKFDYFSSKRAAKVVRTGT